MKISRTVAMKVLLVTIAAGTATLVQSGVMADEKALVGAVVDISKDRPWLPPQSPLTTAQQRTLEDFNKVFRLSDATPNGKGVPAGELAALRKKVREEYGIRMENGNLEGKPISYYKKIPGGTASKATAVPNELDMLDVMNTINQLTEAYGNASPAQAEELKNMDLDLCRHILNQGLVEGAPLAVEPFRIASKSYDWLGKTAGILRMRQPLAEAGLLLPMTRAIAWWQNCTWLDKTPCDNNSDYWRCGYWEDIIHAVAAMPDSPEKWQRVSAMMRYFSNNIVVGPALPPDGEFNHHNGFHLAYSYGVSYVLRDAVALHRLGLELSMPDRERLRAYGRTITWMLLNERYATSLALRAGGPEGRKAITQDLRYLADLGEPGGSGPIDTEMAALYLASAKVEVKDEAAARYRAAGVTPAVLEGAMAMPMRPAMIWRNPSLLISVAAMRPDLRGYEVYAWTQNNIQCRYPLNGSVIVMKAGAKQPTPGFEPEKGWNWSLWPGATSLIESDVALTPRQQLVYGHNHSPVGGVCVLGNNTGVAVNIQSGTNAAGLFMVDFDPEYKSVTFRKSVFAIGGHVLVQTSGISSTKKETCVTTLYQDYMESPTQPSFLDGVKITQLPVTKEIALDSAHTLTDAVGMNYVALPVPGRSQPPRLCVLRRHQFWRLPYDKFIKSDYPNPQKPYEGSNQARPLPQDLSTEDFMKQFVPQEGDYAVAYFDHGSAPQDAADAFILTPEPEKTGTTAVPVILTQTKAGHAAFDEPSRTYAYAAFEPELKWESGPLVHTGRPAAVLIRDLKDGIRQISVASWDVKNTVPFSLILKGVWQVTENQAKSIVVTVQAQQTKLEIPYLGDLPQILKLRQK